MFERFTHNARRAIVLAQDEARSLGHGFIGPEHLLLGLVEGEGLAAKALEEAGVELGAVRDKVAGVIPSTQSARKVDKVPFSPQAKKSLELSLREALHLGHNYIGTEHLLLGILRGANAKESRIEDVLGTGVDGIRARVLEAVGVATSGASRSPALAEATGKARQSAGKAPITTGDLLTAILADSQSLATRALAALGVTSEAFAGALSSVPVEETSDAIPAPETFEIKVGDVTTTIEDPELASVLKGLSADEVRAALAKVFGQRRGRRSSA